MRADVPDPAGTWAWWAETWGYLIGPAGVLLVALLAVLAGVLVLEARAGRDDPGDD